MKKWLSFFFVFLIIIIIWASIDSYQHAFEYRDTQSRKAVQVAMQTEPQLEITDISFYNGNKSYTIIYGMIGHLNRIVYVPTNGKDDVLIIDPTKGISADQAVNKLLEDRNPSVIKSVNLGIEQNVPIWEIVYLDKENRYSYYYVTFKDGQFIKRYTL
jgi:uncharacterized protein YpmB